MPDQIKAAQLAGIQNQIAELRAQEAILSGNPNLAIGLRLAVGRKAKIESVAKAAEKLDITPAQINQIESRGAGLTMVRFISYCTVLELDANEMLGLKQLKAD